MNIKKSAVYKGNKETLYHLNQSLIEVNNVALVL